MSEPDYKQEIDNILASMTDEEVITLLDVFETQHRAQQELDRASGIEMIPCCDL